MKQAQRFSPSLNLQKNANFEENWQVLLANEVEGEHKPDVSINISSSDLAGVLKVCQEQKRGTHYQRFSSGVWHPLFHLSMYILQGSLPPLQAYLTGRISTSGDVRNYLLLCNITHYPIIFIRWESWCSLTSSPTEVTNPGPPLTCRKKHYLKTMYRWTDGVISSK